MLNFFSPTLDDLTLLRTWIRGIPLAALATPVTGDTFKRLSELRSHLYLKAVRLQQPQPEHWLKRQPQASWERRALADLDRLIQLPDIAPDPLQPLGYWLPLELSELLIANRFHTVADVVNAFQQLGSNWWQSQHHFGRTKAKRVEQTIHALFPGVLIYQPLTPVLQYETGPVPLERFLMPVHLDGTDGRNRSREEPFIPLEHDLAAINAWLALFDPTSHTHRNYRREVERLLLWAIIAQRKALSSLDATDLAAYRTFLHDPQPATLWIAPPRNKRNPNWRPFTGPLSARSIQHAETILNGLFDFLVQQRYWQHNPLSVLPRLKTATGQGTLAVHRAFSPTQWERITASAQQCVYTASGQMRRKAIRTQLILHLAYATGLRLSELAQATVGDLIKIERQGQAQTWLSVLGKGQKQRQVPLPAASVQLLTQFYRALTERELQRQPPNTPLIPDLHNSQKAITSVAVHKVLKKFFAELAARCEVEAPEAAAQLLKASAHWLRHTHGSVAVAQNIPLVMIRDNLGHASITTTSQYLHAEADARYEAFENLFNGNITGK